MRLCIVDAAASLLSIPQFPQLPVSETSGHVRIMSAQVPKLVGCVAAAAGGRGSETPLSTDYP